jgi:REP element-mobilizing transposase RayT
MPSRTPRGTFFRRVPQQTPPSSSPFVDRDVMARRPRGDFPGSWHHVVNRAIAKRPYFEARSDQRYFLARLADEVRVGRIEVHAYCLMTTHFHLLVRSPKGELSEAMRRVQCAYSRYFNRRRRRDGPLIRARYFSKRIDTGLYWRAVVRYIDENAVRAGIVPSSCDYEFCSARAFLRGRCPPWLTRDAIEQRALGIAHSDQFSPSVYLAAYGPHRAEDLDSLCDVVESRMRSARELDPLEDLVGATPRQVREWMQRKAVLADGMEVGLPVCGVAGLRRVIDRELVQRGEWFLDRNGDTWRGSQLTWIGLCRGLCGLPVSRIAGLVGRSEWHVRHESALFRSFLAEDAEHAARAERVASAALSASLPLQP